MVLDARSGPAPTRLQAHVVRVAEDGVGVEWNEFAPEPICALMRPAASQSADSSSREEAEAATGATATKGRARRR
jgi:hypothetical protein